MQREFNPYSPPQQARYIPGNHNHEGQPHLDPASYTNQETSYAMHNAGHSFYHGHCSPPSNAAAFSPHGVSMQVPMAMPMQMSIPVSVPLPFPMQMSMPMALSVPHYANPQTQQIRYNSPPYSQHDWGTPHHNPSAYGAYPAQAYHQPHPNAILSPRSVYPNPSQGSEQQRIADEKPVQVPVITPAPKKTLSSAELLRRRIPKIAHTASKISQHQKYEEGRPIAKQSTQAAASAETKSLQKVADQDQTEAIDPDPKTNQLQARQMGKEHHPSANEENQSQNHERRPSEANRTARNKEDAHPRHRNPNQESRRRGKTQHEDLKDEEQGDHDGIQRQPRKSSRNRSGDKSREDRRREVDRGDKEYKDDDESQESKLRPSRHERRSSPKEQRTARKEEQDDDSSFDDRRTQKEERRHRSRKDAEKKSKENHEATKKSRHRSDSPIVRSPRKNSSESQQRVYQPVIEKGKAKSKAKHESKSKVDEMKADVSKFNSTLKALDNLDLETSMSSEDFELTSPQDRVTEEGSIATKDHHRDPSTSWRKMDDTMEDLMSDIIANHAHQDAEACQEVKKGSLVLDEIEKQIRELGIEETQTIEAKISTTNERTQNRRDSIHDKAKFAFDRVVKEINSASLCIVGEDQGDDSLEEGKVQGNKERDCKIHINEGQDRNAQIFHDEYHSRCQRSLYETKGNLTSTTASGPYGFQTLIMDLGSHSIKIGKNTSLNPIHTLPTVVGRPKYPRAIILGGDSPHECEIKQDSFVGSRAQDLRSILSLTQPINRGRLTNFNALNDLISHGLSCISAFPTSDDHYAAVVTEPPLCPLRQREQLVELLFEEQGMSAVKLCSSAALALYACGLSSGLVLDSGDGLTHTLPVYHGYGIPHARHCLALGGCDVTSNLQRMLREKGVYMGSSISELETVRAMKEHVCFVKQRAATGVGTDLPDQQLKYALPDGNIVSCGKERWEACEPLFNPTLSGMEDGGVADMIVQTVKKCDVDIHKDLWSNIVLCGGNTMLSGFSHRLKQELSSQRENGPRPTIIEEKDRNLLAFRGASLLASNSSSFSSFITKDIYLEHGSKVVHQINF